MGQEQYNFNDNWSRTGFLFPQIHGSLQWTAQDPICHLLWEVPLRIKSLGGTSKCGRLGPVTTLGDQAQITKPGISKIGALEN